MEKSLIQMGCAWFERRRPSRTGSGRAGVGYQPIHPSCRSAFGRDHPTI